MKHRRLALSAGAIWFTLLAPLTSVAADYRANYRIEAGVGIAHGDHDVTFSESVGSFGLSIEPSSALSGSGPAVVIAAWVDGLFFQNLSFGLEYLRFENAADLALTGRTPGQSVTVDADFELNVDAIMLNAAYRRNSGAIHPYAALGLGAAYVAGEVDGDVAGTPVIAEIGRIEFSASDYLPAVQIAMGVDYDVTETVYIGAAMRYFVTDSLLLEQDEIIRELAATVKLGVLF